MLALCPETVHNIASGRVFGVFPMELTIDTSSNRTSVTLSHKGEAQSSFAWLTASNHSRELLPNLISLLRQARVGLSSLEAIIVARGPGSFNGLRVGISAAKGLALVLEVPLLGVDTLEAEAFTFAFTGFPLRPIHKAGRDEIATALYRQENDEWHCLEETRLTTVRALCRRTGRRTLFCGEIPADVMSDMLQSLGKKAIIPTGNTPFRGGALAALGYRRLSKGARDDPATLQPLYLRPPNITKPRARTPRLVTVNETREKDKWKSPD
jgi:tRNA threonylcarbamoyl adenosine modification protein YeaZ